MNLPNRPISSLFHSFVFACRHQVNQELLIVRYSVAQEKNHVSQIINWLRARTARQWMYSGLAASLIMLVGLAGLSLQFLNSRNHVYSFSDSNSNCFLNPIILPNTFKSSGSETYQTATEPKISISNTPLLSTTTCLEIAKIPEAGAQDTVTIKSPIAIQKDINLTTDKLPQLTAYESTNEPMSTDAVLLFNTDVLDKTFRYSLQIGDKETNCVLHDKLLGCPLVEHALIQGKTYPYTIRRVLNKQTSEVTSANLTTLDPVTILSSSIAPNENVYTKPQNITLTTNKNIKSVDEVSLKSTETKVDYPVTTQTVDSSVVINFSDELPRNTNFTLLIESITSGDGAFLSEPYTLNFKTSPGPQLQSVNIGTYKINPASSVTLTFDVELDINQPVADFVNISNSAGIVSSSVSVQNNTITINPVANLNSCTSYTISLNNQLLSKFGVSGGSAWSMQTRTVCQTAFTVGTSVLGRSITGYKFGNGATKIVFIGGLHGNEKSSVLTLNSWLDELERNYQNIPSDKTVIVIPNTNPDAYASSSRLNANNIDLNRNFPSNNWQSGVHIPGNIYLESGGGTSPLSEPESSAVANFLIQNQPRLVLTYHATAGAVIYNGSGNSSALSAIYSDKSGYSNYSSAHEDGLFNYPTTGEMEDWLRDKRNTPTLLVELATQYSNNFNRQKSAMWAMLEN